LTISVTTIPRVIPFGTPGFTLALANAEGSALTAVRSDASLLTFDDTVPVTQAFSDTAATGSATVAGRRDHVHGMMATPATAVSSEIITATRATAAASGDVSYTGVGFAPTALICIAVNTTSVQNVTFGFGVSDAGESLIILNALAGTPAMSLEAANFINMLTAPAQQFAILKTLDADGFTLTWEKGGTGQASAFQVLCLR